ncbi:MAG: c-type cytochrome [Gemmatimonadetes bacterium]|nr:c-type cytochrome [Gemmatimonadota bacterium]
MRRESMLFPLVTAAIVLLAAGCQQSADEADEGAPVDTAGAPMEEDATEPAGDGAAGDDAGGADEMALGTQVYEANCATCHGSNGGGDGPAGAGLQPPPAKFDDAEWKYGGDLASVTNTINNGIPGTAMIAWKGTLTDAEIQAVAKHEIAFSQGGATASAR